ncbi:hypothetical protein D024_3938 [Vibrio parahaemolyticus 3259]|nr:hypothetical protein VCHENC01_4206 [Vibrio harveyi]EQM15959.1 hypothetical protein D024_3938 [Vibrio parahaemolyticus 3259]ETJ94476.1 hypothetical protein D041_0644 [Vibrio parahaemolyticus EKP-008]
MPVKIAALAGPHKGLGVNAELNEVPSVAMDSMFGVLITPESGRWG